MLPALALNLERQQHNEQFELSGGGGEDDCLRLQPGQMSSSHKPTKVGWDATVDGFELQPAPGASLKFTKGIKQQQELMQIGEHSEKHHFVM